MVKIQKLRAVPVIQGIKHIRCFIAPFQALHYSFWTNENP